MAPSSNQQQPSGNDWVRVFTEGLGLDLAELSEGLERELDERLCAMKAATTPTERRRHERALVRTLLKAARAPKSASEPETSYVQSMGRGKKPAMRATAATAALPTAVPLSDGGRRKRVPAFEVVPPPTPTERLLDRLLLGEETDRWGHTTYRYKEDGLDAVLAELGVVSAELTYSGGHDEGGIDDLTVEFSDGRCEKWQQTWPKPEKPDEALQWHLVEALWQPAANEWETFAGEFTVQGSVTWTPEDGLQHSYEDRDDPDYCEACDEEYEAGTVTFHVVGAGEGHDYGGYICQECYDKLTAGDTDLTARYELADEESK